MLFLHHDEDHVHHDHVMMTTEETNNTTVLSNNIDAASSFCNSMGGGGMIMYMDGFRWTLSQNNNNPCLNLLFPSWTLNSRTKFVAAMVGVFGLAVLAEGVSKLRHVIVMQARKQRRLYRLRRRRRRHQRPEQRNYQSRGNESLFLLRQANEFLSEHLQTLVRWTIVLLHGLQALVGYILMLAIMTYSVELFLVVILGLAVGYAIFFGRDMGGGGGGEHDEDNDVAVHVTTNPCCNFMQDEASEVRPRQRQQQQQQHAVAGTDDDDTPGNPSSSSHGLHPLNAPETNEDDQGTEPLLRSHR